MIPSHKRYIEVFVGGGSIFFRKNKVKVNILNDKHSDLVNLYMVISQQYDEFKSECDALLKSRILYDNMREELKTDIDYESIPNVRRASRYFYVIRNAFNSSPINPMSKYSAWNKSVYSSLQDSREKLEKTMIENLDFRVLLKKYPPKENDFWYLDPPYFVAGDRGDYYLNNLNAQDHIELYEMVNTIDREGGKVMVSYDDREEVINMYSNFNIMKIPVKYSAQIHSDKLKNELVITNYDIETEQYKTLGALFNK